MPPAVSVILPTYNRAQLVQEATESVLSQTFGDFELIVVDDGSTDDTATVLSGLDNRLRYVAIAHGGASAARNAGLARARGPLIAFLDSDDLWQPHFLQQAIDSLAGADSAGFAYTDYCIAGAQGQISAPCLKAAEKINGRLFPAILEEDFICMGSLLFRRECLEQAGPFDPRVTPAEDWDMWLRITPFYDACYVDRPLLTIRFHGGNMSQQPGVIHRANLRIMRKFQQNFPQFAAQHRSTIRHNCRRYHHSLARHYWRQRQSAPAVSHLLQMILARA